MTNRRGFLGMLSAAIAGATLDPERLLWEPGKKLISIPKITAYDERWMVSMDEFSYRYIAPALKAIADEIDLQLFADVKFYSGDKWDRSLFAAPVRSRA